ncbi:DDE superfamily endonuclease [Ceratobasidium sp. AG-Ba]|nr:DDE superfamily endonuclease [Ceratobasidium sp. AG-Ba]
MGQHTKARRARIQTITRARKIQQERLEQRSNLPEPDTTSLTTPSTPPHGLQPIFDHDTEPMEPMDCEPTAGEDLGLFEDEFSDVELAGGCEENEEEDWDRQQARNELEADRGESEDSDLEADDNRICVVNKQPISIEDCERMVTVLDKIVADSITGQGRHKSSKLDDVTLSRIRLMTASLRLRCGLKCGLQKASQLAAVSVRRGTWAARRTRRYIHHFLTTNMLPENLYGGRWNESIIADEDFLSAVKTHLLGIGKYAQARDILTFCGLPAAGEFTYLLDSPPSLRTAQCWMRILGYRWKEEKRGQYTDSHERPDVVEYWMKYYVPEWFKLEPRMRSWDSEDKEILPTLKEGDKIAVVWFHDESTLYAHDRRRTRWCLEGESLAIYKKGEGISMMVADFVSADYGWLRCCSENQRENEEENHARVIWHAGSRRDGWFCMRDVAEQLEHAIAIVKDQYPNEEHVFVFDNAPIHKKRPDNAPNVARMTLNRSDCVLAETAGPDGKKIKVKMLPARFSDGSPQELYYPIDYPNRSWRGKFKGLATLLEERGVPNAQKLRLKCPTTEVRKGCPPGQTNCCAKRAMLNQPDFLHQKTELQLIAESHSCRVLFLPKFHCKLNPIEQCWGMAKRVYRDYPDSSAEADLRRNILSALDAVPIDSICR